MQTRGSLNGVNPADGSIYWTRETEAFRGMDILTPVVTPAEAVFGDGDASAATILTSTYGGGTKLLKVARSPETNGGGDWAVTELWANNRQGYMSTPVVTGGHAYQHLRNDRVVCVRLSDGEATWTGKPVGGYWSSVTDGDRVLALDARGELLLLAADPTEQKILSRRDVPGDNAWAHVAVVPGRIYVRTLDKLIAYDF